jgi:hypothetical protein
MKSDFLIICDYYINRLLAVDVNIPNISFHSFLTINDEVGIIVLVIIIIITRDL